MGIKMNRIVEPPESIDYSVGHKAAEAVKKLSLALKKLQLSVENKLVVNSPIYLPKRKKYKKHR